jgi:hypothetical protein
MSSTTLSTTQPMYSEFEARNAGLAPRVERMLAEFCADAPTHARLLNTLSMLEHIGSRKIMATQSAQAAMQGLDQDTLKHLAEEARHAFFFKRQAERAAGRRLDYASDALAAPAAARMYFQRLDATLSKALREAQIAAPRAAYYAMSMIVEFRAVWLYRIYQPVLARLASPISLKSLLAEEEAHLERMADGLRVLGALEERLVRRLCDAERRLFERALGALERDLEAPALAA